MLRIANFSKCVTVQKAERRMATIEEAIKALREGKQVAIKVGNTLYALDRNSTFATDFDFLLNAEYYIR